MLYHETIVYHSKVDTTSNGLDIFLDQDDLLYYSIGESSLRDSRLAKARQLALYAQILHCGAISQYETTDLIYVAHNKREKRTYLEHLHSPPSRAPPDHFFSAGRAKSSQPRPRLVVFRRLRPKICPANPTRTQRAEGLQEIGRAHV